MQLLQPSDHTLLLNLGIFLGHPNEVISPLLLQCGYPLKELSLRIPTPGYQPGSSDSAAVPDLGYSSSKDNKVLFLEAKGGGTDDNQIERFQYIQNNPNTLVAIRNNLDIVSKNLNIDFGLLCSDIEKVKQNHNQTAIPFPVIFYDKKIKICVTMLSTKSPSRMIEYLQYFLLPFRFLDCQSCSFHLVQQNLMKICPIS